MTIRGSCLCGDIKFELIAPPSMMASCHCSRCRKIGAQVFVFVKRDDFVWISGEDKVAKLAPVPPYKYARCFCPRCGTALGEPGAGESFPINANCLDDDPGVRMRFHEFVSEKPGWHEIGDDAKQFAEHPVKPSQS